MKSHLKVEMTVATLRAMSPEQLKALQENILAEGRWETFDPATEVLHVSGHGDYIGIEKDGHTHS
jgi:hypothetical protein